MIPPERRRFQTEHPRGARCPPGNWVSVYRKAPPQDEEPLTISERAQLRELQREVRDLRMKNDFLGKYATFFALRVQVLFFRASRPLAQPPVGWTFRQRRRRSHRNDPHSGQPNTSVDQLSHAPPIDLDSFPRVKPSHESTTDTHTPSGLTTPQSHRLSRLPQLPAHQPEGLDAETECPQQPVRAYRRSPNVADPRPCHCQRGIPE
jgi:hypothetical protein